jgi:hypothetical protein
MDAMAMENELADKGYFDQRWASTSAPLLEFGTMFHRQGERPGVSPAETMYWFDGVLVSLVLVVDDAAVSAAVAWGLQQDRSNFQLIAMSLFEVILAEVSMKTDRKGARVPFVRFSQPLKLSAMSEAKYARLNPEKAEELKERTRQGYRFSDLEGAQQSRRSKAYLYPGYGALINFLDVAAQRRCAAKSPGALPAEMYCKILDHVDYNTWRACSTVSPAFRSYCLLKYRLNDQWIIPLQPEPLWCVSRQEPFFYFEPQDPDTGFSYPAVEKQNEWRCHGLPRFNWMPIIGAEPRALMLNVLLEFEDPEFPENDESDEDDGGASEE